MSAGVLVVFAKAPRPGAVKTRMCPPLRPEQAAKLYEELLADVLEASAGFAAALALEPVLTVHPADACRELAAQAPPAFRVIRQRGANLAQRMTWAVREAAAAGADRILLRGSDSPLLDQDAVAAALTALDEVDLALSPDRDGGYNLVALSRPVAGLFAHAMSTASVLEDTLANAKARGLRVRLLAPSFDLDTAADLRWLERARSQASARLCARTLAFLDAEGLWPPAHT